jgi:hypothetical protein
MSRKGFIPGCSRRRRFRSRFASARGAEQMLLDRLSEEAREAAGLSE